MPPKDTIIITNHAKKRFEERIGNRRRSNINKKGIEKTIEKELSYQRIRYIIDIDKMKYIFLKNGKEYRFKKIKDKWLLLTVVRHSRVHYQKRVNKLREEKNLPKVSFKI